jgi:hypothetical protein
VSGAAPGDGGLTLAARGHRISLYVPHCPQDSPSMLESPVTCEFITG